MNRFEYTQSKGTKSYSKTATKQPYTSAGHFGPIAPQYTGEVVGTIKVGDQYLSQTTQHNEFKSTKTVKEKRVSYVPIGDLDAVKRRLDFDDIEVDPESNCTETPNAPPKKNKNNSGWTDVNGIRKFR